MTSYSNLVGPKPEPVKEPQHPTPWRIVGRQIVDANGRNVLRLSRKDEYTTLGLGVALNLSQAIVDAVNEKFAPKVEDAKSPF